MKIPVLALMLRSMRTDNRSLLTYALRFLLVGFLFITLIFVQQEMGSTAAPGLFYFMFIVYIDFFAISLLAISFFSSVITEEKEEMTLGLLKMTGLNPISILLGKSTSRLINGLFLLLAQLPFTLLAVTMGGVDQRQVLAAYVALTAYMIFVCGLAVLASTLCKRSRGAAPLTLAALVAYLLGPFLGLRFVQNLLYDKVITRDGFVHSTYQAFFNWIYKTNAFGRIDEIMTSGYNGPIFNHIQPISNLIFAAIFFILAWIAFNRFTRDDTASAPPRGFFYFLRKKNRKNKHVGRAWDHAIEWHSFHFAVGGISSAILRFMGLGSLFAIFVIWEGWPTGRSSRSGLDWNDIAFGVAICSIMVAYGHAVLFAGSIFQSEIREQTLSAITLLPVSMGKIAYAKVRGAFLALTPYFIWIAVGITLNPDEFFDMLSEILSETAGWFMIANAIFFLHFVALLSLYVKRGAVAVAIVLYLVAGLFIGMMVAVGGLHDGDALFVMISFFQILGCLGIHPWLSNRLNELAAQ